MLVKDFNSRIDWPEIFEYVITQNGEIFASKNVTGANQFQLRNSIKTGFTQSMYSNSNPTISASSNIKQSQRSPAQAQNNVISPKMNKSYDINKE